MSNNTSATTNGNPGARNGPIICPGHSRPVPDLHYSNPTEWGVFLISGCLDGKAMLRSAATGDWIGTFQGHKGAVWCARLNRAATQVATASADFSTKLWDAVTGDEIRTFKDEHIVKCCEFSADGKFLFTAGAKKKLRMYDLTQPDAEPKVLLGHSKAISQLQIVSDPNLILSTSEDEPGIRVWDTTTGETRQILTTPGGVSSLELSADEKILTSTSGRTVQFWDAVKFDLIKEFLLPDDEDQHHANPLNAATLNPDQTLFCTGANDDLWVRCWDFATGAQITTLKGHHGPVRCLAFAPDGKTFSSGSEDGTIRIWQTARDVDSQRKSAE